MKINTNNWNKIRYTLYSPFYDVVGVLFNSLRKKSIELLNADKNEKILIVGAGTGQDIEFLTEYKNMTAIDLTPSMLNILKKRTDKLQHKVEVKIMDGQKLDFENNYFDSVILHFIIAVIPDPIKCIREVERVLKPNGKVIILDKFLADNAHPSPFRKLMNLILGFLTTEINRRLADILKDSKFYKEADIAVAMNGLFRIIKLRKEGK